jgi:uncharacterized membrane protein
VSSEEIERRLANIEIRLARLESMTSGPAVRHAPAVEPGHSSPGGATATGRRPALPPAGADGSSAIGAVLGWGGGIALLLAAAYLIRLGVDSGWLTPTRQVGFAALSGLALIASGFFTRKDARHYTGLLPAVGVAILFLSIYGAHLVHHLIGQKDAGIAIVIVCAVSLWLCRIFRSDLYALFAVAGSYSAPFLLSDVRASLTDLVIYFSAWSVVFCVFAIWHARRLIYLCALYLALIGFDLIWRAQATEQWVVALAFQAVQFAIFGATTALFSVRLGIPLTTTDALVHLPPLLLFYTLQYSLLDQHVPTLAPWIAVASLIAIAALYGVARASMQGPLAGGRLILWAYAALVLVHAGYIESVPRQWQPWVAFVLAPLVAILHAEGKDRSSATWPMWTAVSLIFVGNYLRVVFRAELQAVPARQLLAVAYALLLYAGFWFWRQQGLRLNIRAVLLYMGHICAMAAALHILAEPIIESAAWGLLAFGWLGLSLRLNDPLLRQSSIAIFGATAGKVILYDLSGASPVARIIGLVVLGFTFYFGGLLYQRLLGEAKPR